MSIFHISIIQKTTLKQTAKKKCNPQITAGIADQSWQPSMLNITENY